MISFNTNLIVFVIAHCLLFHFSPAARVEQRVCCESRSPSLRGDRLQAHPACSQDDCSRPWSRDLQVNDRYKWLAFWILFLFVSEFCYLCFVAPTTWRRNQRRWSLRFIKRRLWPLPPSQPCHPPLPQQHLVQSLRPARPHLQPPPNLTLPPPVLLLRWVIASLRLTVIFRRAK